MCNYPVGTKDDPRAPWNEKEPKLVEVEVEVALVITKKVIVEVPEEHEQSDITEAVRDIKDWHTPSGWELKDWDWR